MFGSSSNNLKLYKNILDMSLKEGPDMEFYLEKREKA